MSHKGISNVDDLRYSIKLELNKPIKLNESEITETKANAKKERAENKYYGKLLNETQGQADGGVNFFNHKAQRMKSKS